MDTYMDESYLVAIIRQSHASAGVGVLLEICACPVVPAEVKDLAWSLWHAYTVANEHDLVRLLMELDHFFMKFADMACLAQQFTRRVQKLSVKKAMTPGKPQHQTAL